MRFPTYSTYTPIKTNWIKFTPHLSFGDSEQLGESIFLPAAKDISLGDSARYNTVDLGVIGNAINKGLSNTEGTMKGFISDLDNTEKMSESMLSSLYSAAGLLGAAGVKKMTMSAAPAVATLQAKSVMNPHTTNLFAGIDIRSFGFSAVMIPSSAEETSEVKRIIDYFREHLYPELGGVVGHLQRFPPTWTIDFFYGDGTSEGTQTNQYLPKIHRCFLRSFTSTYNTTGNSFHPDGSPFDYSIQLQFEETKIYSKQTILTGEEETITPQVETQ